MANAFKSSVTTPDWLIRFMRDGGYSDTCATDLYSRVPLYYRALNLRCDALAAVPTVIAEGDKERDWPYKTPVHELVWNLEMQLLLTGAAFAEIVRNQAGYIRDVVPVRDVTVKYDRGVYTFEQNGIGGATWTNEPSVNRFEMLYIREFSPRTQVLPGVGAGEVAAGYARVLHALEAYHGAYIQGGGLPVTVVGVETNDQEEIGKLEAFFKRIIGSSNRSEKVVATASRTVDIKTITPMPKDMAFDTMHEQARDGIANAFGIPKTLLDSEAANYATAKEDRLAFYEDKIKSRAMKMAGEINHQVLQRDKKKYEMRFAFEELALFQEDQSDRITSLEAYVRSGFTILEAADLSGIELTDDVRKEIVERLSKADESIDTNSDFRADLSRWQRKAQKALKAGKSASVAFESSHIRGSLHAAILGQLEDAQTADDVRKVFSGAQAWEAY